MNWETLSLAVGWAMLVAFTITFVITVLGLIGKIQIPPKYLALLFSKLILEVVAAVFLILHNGMTKVIPYDISGCWRYSCTASNLAVGGYCNISSEISGGRVVWSLKGERLWKQIGTNYVDFAVTKGIPWKSNWAEILGRDELRFRYSLKPDGDSIDGLGEGTIEAKNKVGYRISGTFYQLPPQAPLHGVMKFERIKNEEEAYPAKKTSAN